MTNLEYIRAATEDELVELIKDFGDKDVPIPEIVLAIGCDLCPHSTANGKECLISDIGCISDEELIKIYLNAERSTHENYRLISK